VLADEFEVVSLLVPHVQTASLEDTVMVVEPMYAYPPFMGDSVGVAGVAALT
jgi:hypothetical protein